MKARWRIFVAVSIGLLQAGVPALAQEAPAPADTSVPPQNAVVGPPQLSNFSLNGTVTKPAPTPTPAPTQTAPRPSPTANSGGQAQSTSAGAATPPPSAPPEQRSRPAPTPTRSDGAAPTDVAPPPVPQTFQPSADTTSEAPVTAPVSTAPASDLNVSSTGGFGMLPWLLAAIAIAAAGAWYFLRQRPRESYAGAGGIDLFERTPAPPPSPAPAPPRPAAQPAPVPRAANPAPQPAPQPVSTGLVSTRLRPWIEIEFVPTRAIVDGEKAAVQFELSLLNSGNAPARGILVEASLFNAGPSQDQQIGAFFQRPPGEGDRIPLIGPLQRVTLTPTVVLPRSSIVPIEMEGRQLLVPMIAFNAVYTWSAGAGQSSASYLIGKATDGEKLAPFRLDIAPRIYRNLSARQHELRLRK